MLILLMIFLIIATIVILLVKRNKESVYLFAMTLSLAIMLTGILIYIAKKGGITRDLQNFLFLSNAIKTKIQYLLITLSNLGLLIAIGRFLFPMFFLLLALQYTMIPWIRKTTIIKRMVPVLPILSLVAYTSQVFQFLTESRPLVQQAIVWFSRFWVNVYVIIALVLLCIELFSITIKFCRTQFIQIVIFISSLAVLYLLYCGQDPAQVYQFYSNDYLWKNGIYYMNSTLSVQAYTIIVIGNVICGVLGIISFLKYTQRSIAENKEDYTMKNKFDTVSMGASVFVHSIKNQLLANRVIHKRIKQLYDKVENNSLPDQESRNEIKIDHPVIMTQEDILKLTEYTDALATANEVMLTRLDELYRSVKTNTLYLVPIKLSELFDTAIERFHSKFPDKEIEVNMRIDATVLADKTHLVEAIYNLLVNGQEAINEANKEEIIDSEVKYNKVKDITVIGKEEIEKEKIDKVKITGYNERLYTIIEVKDTGIGMNNSVLKKMFEPFYSSKNSNYNWGMGLHYVRAITRGHFGNLHYRSKPGEGTTFYILLPRYNT